MFTWPTPLKYPESEPSTPLTPLKYPESMSKYTEAIAEVYLLSSECNFNAMLTRKEASTPRRYSTCICLPSSPISVGSFFKLSEVCTELVSLHAKVTSVDKTSLTQLRTMHDAHLVFFADLQFSFVHTIATIASLY